MDLDRTLQALHLRSSGRRHGREVGAADDLHAAASRQERDGHRPLHGVAFAPRSDAQRHHRQLQSAARRQLFPQDQADLRGIRPRRRRDREFSPGKVRERKGIRKSDSRSGSRSPFLPFSPPSANGLRMGNARRRRCPIGRCRGGNCGVWCRADRHRRSGPKPFGRRERSLSPTRLGVVQRRYLHANGARSGDNPRPDPLARRRSRRLPPRRNGRRRRQMGRRPPPGACRSGK